MRAERGTIHNHLNTFPKPILDLLPGGNIQMSLQQLKSSEAHRQRFGAQKYMYLFLNIFFFRKTTFFEGYMKYYKIVS